MVAGVSISATPQFAEKERFPGEDVKDASVVRRRYGIPFEEELQLEEGVMWYRWFGDISNSQKTPIVLSIGGTGTAMFYKTFAQSLQVAYEGPVLIWDRFNIGLSDRIVESKNGMDLWLSQLVQMTDLLIGVDRKSHFVGFSLACIIMMKFVTENPGKVDRLGLISGYLGGAGQTVLRPYRMIKRVLNPVQNIFCCCCPYYSSSILMKAFQVPKFYTRSEHQVEEGADPDGLPICKAMYRVKHTAAKMVQQFQDPIVLRVTYNGCDELCERLSATGIPVYARNYIEDQDVDKEKFNRVWSIIKMGNPLSSAYDVANGEHHMFYADNTVSRLAEFMQQQQP